MFCRVSERYKYCIAGDRIILLDVEELRYLGLPSVREQAFFRLLDEQGTCDKDDPGLRDLLADGIVEQSKIPCVIRAGPDIPSPTSDFRNVASKYVSYRFFLRAVSWELRVAARLRLQPVSTMVSRLSSAQRSSATSCRRTQGTLLDVAAAFERTQLLLGRKDRCLVRSIAMFSLYWSLGIATKLVIGVRSDPFTAHCWVQHEAQVLNDVAEHARSFTPIWVLE